MEQPEQLNNAGSNNRNNSIEQNAKRPETNHWYDN